MTAESCGATHLTWVVAHMASFKWHVQSLQTAPNGRISNVGRQVVSTVGGTANEAPAEERSGPSSAPKSLNGLAMAMVPLTAAVPASTPVVIRPTQTEHVARQSMAERRRARQNAAYQKAKERCQAERHAHCALKLSPSAPAPLSLTFTDPLSSSPCPRVGDVVAPSLNAVSELASLLASALFVSAPVTAIAPVSPALDTPALAVAQRCTVHTRSPSARPPVFIPSLNRPDQFNRLLTDVLYQYNGDVYCVLNNVYLADGSIDLPRVTGYLELSPQFSTVHFWLLDRSISGLAAVRSDIIKRTAGMGPVLVMDDDAKRFALTVKSARGNMVSKVLSFGEVVDRLLAARTLTGAKVLGINHWYHHMVLAHQSGAVTSGCQHISFQPMMLDLPSPVPERLTTYYSHVEDDEFILKAAEEYGAGEIVKLRYMIARFDVGTMAGGIQSGGMKHAKAKQLAESHAIMVAHPGKFDWAVNHGRHAPSATVASRLAAPRVRLSRDAMNPTHVPRMGVLVENLVTAPQEQ